MRDANAFAMMALTGSWPHPCTVVSWVGEEEEGAGLIAASVSALDFLVAVHSLAIMRSSPYQIITSNEL
jgi:hypothetical protein